MNSLQNPNRPCTEADKNCANLLLKKCSFSKKIRNERNKCMNGNGRTRARPMNELIISAGGAVTKLTKRLRA